MNKTNLSELKLKDGTFEIQIRSKDYIKNKASYTEAPNIISMAPPAANLPVSAPAAAVPAPIGEALPKVESTEKVSGEENLITVKSPIVGTFYRSSSPDKPPFAKVGDTIKTGDVVCIVEAMKLFNEIESEVSGKIVKVLVEDASPVEYDQALFLVEPA